MSLLCVCVFRRRQIIDSQWMYVIYLPSSFRVASLIRDNHMVGDKADRHQITTKHSNVQAMGKF